MLSTDIFFSFPVNVENWHSICFVHLQNFYIINIINSTQAWARMQPKADILAQSVTKLYGHSF